MSIISIRHRWPEKPGIFIYRPNGNRYHTFLHFIKEAKIKINDTVITAAPDSCIFIPSGALQYYGSDIGLLHDWMHYDEKSALLLKDLGVEENKLLHISNGSSITKIMAELEYEFFSNHKFSEEIMDLKFKELIYSILRNSTTTENVKYNPLDIQTITDVREKMMLNIDKHWTTTKLAKSAQMSHSKFHYIYKTYFGISPIDDLINARIQLAKDILVSENITIRELAAKLGYSDVTHFIRQFTSKVGISPKQYAVKYS